MTILFQGDSITDGGRSRDEDPNHVMGHGYAYLAAARLGADFPGRGYRFVNRGISGHRSVDLYARWQEDALSLAPDVVSILMGVNDVGHAYMGKKSAGGIKPAKFEKVYRLILSETLEPLPSVRFLLCEPFGLAVGVVQVENGYLGWLDELREVTRRVAQDFGATFVPLQDLFTDAARNGGAQAWLWDGIHPTPAGHELIARRWVAAFLESPPS